MTDEFDSFLASALAPPERDPDRAFVTSVQARIIVEDRFASTRRTLLARYVEQLFALFAVAAAAWVITRAAPVASRFGESPAVALAVLVCAFALFVLLIGRPEAEPQLASGL